MKNWFTISLVFVIGFLLVVIASQKWLVSATPADAPAPPLSDGIVMLRCEPDSVSGKIKITGFDLSLSSGSFSEVTKNGPCAAAISRLVRAGFVQFANSENSNFNYTFIK